MAKQLQLQPSKYSNPKSKAKRRRSHGLDLAHALGASTVMTLRTRAGGPHGVKAMLHEINARLVSRGGRPSISEHSIRRLIPLAPEQWAELRELSIALSEKGRSISPGQFAALLIQRGLEEFEYEHKSKSQPMRR